MVEDALIINRMGVITGSTSSVQFPDVECGIVQFKADANNIGTFFIGGDEVTCVFPLDAGNWTPSPINLRNLNQLWHSNPSGTSEYLYYWLQM